MNAARALATLLSAGWLLIAGVAAAQQSSPLEQVQEQIQALLKQGKSAEVEMFLKQLLTLAVLQSGPDGDAATEIRLGLAWVYAQLLRLEEAE